MKSWRELCIVLAEHDPRYTGAALRVNAQLFVRATVNAERFLSRRAVEKNAQRADEVVKSAKPPRQPRRRAISLIGLE